MDSPASLISALYERRAREYDRERGRSLQERGWLDRFLEHIPSGGTVLDLGCGMGEPVAAYVLGTGRMVVGVDSSPTLIALCRERFPQAHWTVGDMRAFDLKRHVDGILAWDSFFHLTAADQRRMFQVFARHAAPDTRLMFTSGSSLGEAIGEYHGEPLYHASLDPDEYRSLLETNGFRVDAYVEDDAECGHHSVWLATRVTAAGSV